MFDCGLHANGESDPLPNVPTPKRDRGEMESLDSDDDQLEQPGVGKRMHVDSSVKIANQFYAPSPLRGMKEKEPTDAEVDQSEHQDDGKPKAVELLASKLAQL